MFEPEFSKYSWAPELAAAAAGGPDEARRFARKVRSRLDDDDADAIGEELLRLLQDGEIPPFLAALSTTAPTFSGPRTIAVAGETLRTSNDPALVELAFEVLNENQLAPSAIQQLLCAREAQDPAVRERAASMFRFGRMAVRHLASVANAEAPQAVLERYFTYALETSMLEGGRYRAPDFAAAVAGPAGHMLKRTLWAHYEGRRPTRTFIVDPEDTALVDAEWEPVTLDPADMVGVVHPAELSQAERSRWGQAMADNEIVGLFNQLDRACERTQDTLPFDEILRDAPASQLHRFLSQHGWRQIQSKGYHGPSRKFELAIRGAALRLQAHQQPDDMVRLNRMYLIRPDLERVSTEDDVIYSEAVTGGYALLSRFAPELA